MPVMGPRHQIVWLLLPNLPAVVGEPSCVTRLLQTADWPHSYPEAPSVRVCKASLGDDKLIIRSSESARDAEMYTERSRTALAHFNTSFCWRKRPK